MSSTLPADGIEPALPAMRLAQLDAGDPGHRAPLVGRCGWRREGGVNLGDLPFVGLFLVDLYIWGCVVSSRMGGWEWTHRSYMHITQFTPTPPHIPFQPTL